MHLGVDVLRHIHSIIGQLGGDLGFKNGTDGTFDVHARRPSVGEGILISFRDCDLLGGT